MMFSSRVGLRTLSTFCRRMATSLEAGIEIRRFFSLEAAGKSGSALRRRCEVILAAVAVGDSVGDGLAETGSYFPSLFRELVSVGEETGSLSEVCRQLAEHYEYQLKLRRDFLASIAWPAVQLAIALSVVGLLILIIDFLPNKVDLLGWGLVGTAGLARYVTFLAVVAGSGVFLYQAVRRGMLWTRPLQRAILLVPWLGGALQTLAIARLAWTMNLTFQTGMDLRKALPLAIRSTRNARYLDHADEILAGVQMGRELHEVFAETRAFPNDFIETMRVGEQSGRLAETLNHLSHQYLEHARRSLGVLTMIAGFAVWACVAGLIIMVIFRLAFFYINTLNDAANFTI